MSAGAFGVGDDPLNAGAVAFSASTNAEGETAVLYCALAKMCAVQARQRLEVLERMIAAREAEFVRAAKVARELGTG